MYKPLTLIFIYLLMQVISFANAYAISCDDRRPYCKNMTSCFDALYYLDVCNHHRLDRDNDGVPCESLCGKKLTPALIEMKQGLSKQSESKLGLLSETQPDFKCGLKKTCREMTSCREATYYFKHCSLKHLDGDRDGKPCNRLCK